MRRKFRSFGGNRRTEGVEYEIRNENNRRKNLKKSRKNMECHPDRVDSQSVFHPYGTLVVERRAVDLFYRDTVCTIVGTSEDPKEEAADLCQWL